MVEMLERGRDASPRILLAAGAELRLLDILDRFGERGWICLYARAPERLRELLAEGAARVLVVDPALAGSLPPEPGIPVIFLGNEPLGSLERRIADLLREAGVSSAGEGSPVAAPLGPAAPSDEDEGSRPSPLRRPAAPAGAEPAAAEPRRDTPLPPGGGILALRRALQSHAAGGEPRGPRRRASEEDAGAPPPASLPPLAPPAPRPAARGAGPQAIPSATPGAAPSAVRAAGSGRRLGIDGTPVAVALLDLAFARANGVLRVRNGEISRDIVLQAGAPVASSSNLPGERLSAVLVREGLVSAEQRHIVVELMHQPRSGRDSPLGEQLVQRGVVSEAALARALRSQLETRVLQCVASQDGEILWLPDEPWEPSRAFLGIDMARVVGRALLHEGVGDGLANGLAEHLDAAVLPTRLFDSRSSILGDSDAERALALRIDGSLRLRELVAPERLNLDLRAVLALYLARAIGFGLPNAPGPAPEDLPFGDILSAPWVEIGPPPATSGEAQRSRTGPPPLGDPGARLGPRGPERAGPESAPRAAVDLSSPRGPAASQEPRRSLTPGLGRALRAATPSSARSGGPEPPAPRGGAAEAGPGVRAAERGAPGPAADPSAPLGWLPFPMAPPPQDVRAAGLMSQGRLALQERRLGDAAQFFHRAWEADLSYAEACSLSGWCLFKAARGDEEQLNEGLERLQMGIALANGEALPYLRLGLVLAEMGEAERARVQLQAALQLRPDLREARLALQSLDAEPPPPAQGGEGGGLLGALRRLRREP